MAKVKRRRNMDLEREARRILSDAGRTVARLERSAGRSVAAAAEVMIQSLAGGGTVYFCGNGGSAADAQHFAAELSGRYLLDRASLSAQSLTTNSSAVTAIGNDYGFRQVFARQLAGLGIPGDVLVAITTSGKSTNVFAAVREARRLGMFVVGMTGRAGTAFAERCDVALVSPSTSTPRIQECHVAMGHAVCELIERALFAPLRPAKRTEKARQKPARAKTGRPKPAKRTARPKSARRKIARRKTGRRGRSASA